MVFVLAVAVTSGCGRCPLNSARQTLLSRIVFSAGSPRSFVFSRRSIPYSSSPFSRFESRRRLWTANQFQVKVMSTVAKPDEVVEILTGKDDRYDGVMVEIDKAVKVDTFVASLKASISKWRELGKKGVWLKIPLQFAQLIPVAVEVFNFQEGFWYHHAEPTHLMLVYWLPSTLHTLPANATHRVGIGAFVINSEKQVLVVQEKTGNLRGSGVWKIPTGVIDQGEDISAGAIREVKEETGIDTEFVEILGFRQSHKSFFEKSDLFFVCVLHPLSFAIQKQDSEIEDARWMPLEEYASQPFVQTPEMVKKLAEIFLSKVENRYTGFTPVTIQSNFSGQADSLYLNNKDIDV